MSLTCQIKMIGEIPTPHSVDAVHTTIASGLDIGNVRSLAFGDNACLKVVSARLILQF